MSEDFKALVDMAMKEDGRHHMRPVIILQTLMKN
jgi:hypothetical protein